MDGIIKPLLSAASQRPALPAAKQRTDLEPSLSPPNLRILHLPLRREDSTSPWSSCLGWSVRLPRPCDVIKALANPRRASLKLLPQRGQDHSLASMGLASWDKIMTGVWSDLGSKFSHASAVGFWTTNFTLLSLGFSSLKNGQSSDLVQWRCTHLARTRS